MMWLVSCSVTFEYLGALGIAHMIWESQLFHSKACFEFVLLASAEVL